MILPPSGEIEIENGGDFTTFANIKQFLCSGYENWVQMLTDLSTLVDISSTKPGGPTKSRR